MKILNLHGFMGEADNKNYKALCGIVPSEDIISPQIKYKETSPPELLEKLSAMVDSDDYIFVGQSLGGWYADKMSCKFMRPCILTNPCYYPHELELITSSGISSEFVEQYRKMSVSTQNERAYTLCSDKDIMYNPCEGARLPQNRTTERPLITEEQFASLLKAADTQTMKTAISILGEGLRIGELLALQWKDCIEDMLDLF